MHDKPCLFCYNFHPTSIHFPLKQFWYCNSLIFSESKREKSSTKGFTRMSYFLIRSFLFSIQVIQLYQIEYEWNIICIAQLNGNTPVMIWKWISFMRLNEYNTNVGAAHNSFFAFEIKTDYSVSTECLTCLDRKTCVRYSNWYAIFSGRKQFLWCGCMESLLLYKDVLSYAFNVV